MSCSRSAKISASERAYLDSSAIFKLVREESETAALSRRLATLEGQHSSELAAVEVVRRARSRGSADERAARQILDALALRAIDAEVINCAGTVGAPALRSLDAIHLATAVLLEPDVFISYDRRLNDAAAAAGLTVEAPA